MKTLIKWLACFLSLVIVNAIMPKQLVIPGGMTPILAAGTVLWLVNLILKPVAQIIAIPFTILTFGLFYFVVNTLMVALAIALFPGVEGTFLACLVTALLLSALNALLAVKT